MHYPLRTTRSRCRVFLRAPHDLEGPAAGLHRRTRRACAHACARSRRLTRAGGPQSLGDALGEVGQPGGRLGEGGLDGARVRGHRVDALEPGLQGLPVLMSTWPASAMHGTPCSRARAATTETSLPCSDWASRRPSPVTTRSAPGEGLVEARDLADQLAPPHPAGPERRERHAEPAGGARPGRSARPGALAQHRRPRRQRRVEGRHGLLVRALLRAEHRGGALRAGQDVVDVGGDDEVDALAAAPGRRRARRGGRPARAAPPPSGSAAPSASRVEGAERGEHPGAAVGAGRAAEPDDDAPTDPGAPPPRPSSSPTPRLVADGGAVRGVRSSTRCRPQADADSR